MYLHALYEEYCLIRLIDLNIYQNFRFNLFLGNKRRKWKIYLSNTAVIRRKNQECI